MARPPRPAPSVDELRLARTLRGMREWAGLSLDAAAEKVGKSPSTISRWETAESRITDPNAVALTSAYGIPDADRKRFLAGLERARRPGWWDEYREVIPRWQAGLLAGETAADLIRTLDLLTVPPLLQHPDYTCAHLHTGPDDRRVHATLARQDMILHRPDPPTLWALLPETALTGLAHDPDLARTQIQHLQHLARQPNVTVQIIGPGRGPLPGGSLGPLTYLRYAPSAWPDAVYLHGITSHTQIDDPDDVRRHLAVLDALAAALPPGAATPAHLDRILADL